MNISKLKKILLIAGTFSPEIGYNEVYLAKKFADFGYDVLVVTTTEVSSRAQSVLQFKRYNPGLHTVNGYNIIRVPTLATIKTIVLPRYGLKKYIHKFSPDIVIMPAIAKFLPLFGAFYKNLFNYKLILWSADLFSHRGSFFRKKAFNIVKNPWYSYAIRKSNLVVATTPETKEFLLFNTKKKYQHCLESKIIELPLGYDEKIFYYDNNARYEMRKKYNINDDDLVLITASKPASYKKWESLIDVMKSLRKKYIDLKMFFVGFDNSEYSNTLKAMIKSASMDPYIKCVPFVSHAELCRYYCASDVGIWWSPSITIQEAMGTGLLIVLPNKRVFSHLLRQKGSRSYNFTDNLEEVIIKTYKNFAHLKHKKKQYNLHRRELANRNILFSYGEIVRKLVNELRLS